MENCKEQKVTLSIKIKLSLWPTLSMAFLSTYIFDWSGVGCLVFNAARFNFLRSNPPWKSSLSFSLESLPPRIKDNSEKLPFHNRLHAYQSYLNNATMFQLSPEPSFRKQDLKLKYMTIINRDNFLRINIKERSECTEFSYINRV